MNIVIDQGNTSAKIAVIDGEKRVASFVFNPLIYERLQEILNEFSPTKGLLSSVGEIDPDIIDLLKTRLIQFIELDEHTPLPVHSVYRTPETLGKDRIAAVVGAYMRYPGRNLLVIDAGTAITYDFLNSEGIHIGGNISPGMAIRFKALHDYTKRLPLLDEHGDVPPIGYDTETAIRSGVVFGIIREMNAYIEEFKKYPELLVFLTGGHSFYFETKLNNSIFADENLVLKGLNEILNYQYE